MEWNYLLQTAIDYMESHLLDEIDYDQIAREVGVSSFHFHRVFNMIVGMTCAEYIRKRRLTIAAEAIRYEHKRIIDVAYEFGYQSPESFNKAFVRFHGITPKEARQNNAALNMFAPLKIRLIIEGGTKMKYRIESKHTMNFIVQARSYPNEIAGDENNHDISQFWDAFINEKRFSLISDVSDDDASYGLCATQDKDAKEFKYGIGVMTEGTAEIAGFEPWVVSESTWAVFECYGNDGTCIAAMWKRIFDDFLPNSRYEMIETVDFERYPNSSKDGLFCEIWVPVKEKYK